MAAGWSATTADAALTAAVGTDAAFVQLHTGDPGAAGTSNVSSVTTRKAATWAAAAAGSVVTSNTQSWTNWAGTSPEIVTWISWWDMAAGGTFGGSAQLAAAETMLTGDTLELLSITISIPLAS